MWLQEWLVLAGSYLRSVSAARREKDPTSAAAEPATVLCTPCPPFIPNLHHSQTSALAPIPALCHIRTLTGSRMRGGWGVGVGVQQGGAPRKEGAPSIRIQQRIRSDAARPRRGESVRHIWHCRFDLPSSLAVPPRGPYKERAGHWGFSRGDASCYQPGL